MSTRGRDAGTELPYTGALGATRYEPAFLTGPDGVSRRLDVVRGVNAATDPALSSAALEGELHRIDGGGYLAVPYVYHDPAGRKFALVVPVARSHEELRLRAELLEQLARDVSAPIPSYVREARVAIGMEGLQKYLAEPVDARRGGELESRSESVSQREERLRERAEEVTRREDELLQRVDELELQKADLQVREQQCEARTRDVVGREEALADEERAMRANMAALQSRERMLEARDETLARREAEFVARAQALSAHEEEITANGVRGTAARLDGEPIEGEPIEPVDDEEEDSIEMADPVDEPTPLPARLPGSPRATPSDGETIEAEEFEHDDLLAGRGAPTADVPDAWLARGHDAYAAVVDGEVRVWARGGADVAASLAQGGTALVIQVDPDSKLPLAMLSVVGGHGDRIARAVLDATRPDDRAVLEALGREFRARLEVVSTAGRTLGTHTVADQGESNAQRAAEVLSKREPGSEDARSTETDRLLREGVEPSGGKAIAHALVEENSLTSGDGTATALAEYEALLSPGAVDRFALAWGIPHARIDSFGKRVILAALRCGVPLTPSIVRRAIDVGIAADEKALATRALTAYARTSEGGLDSIGRTAADGARAWKPLIDWADRLGVALPDAARDALRAAFDPDDPESVPPTDSREPPTQAALSAMTDDELLRWSDHQAVRFAVARELFRRDAPAHSAHLARAMRLLEPERAVELAAQMVSAGDALGDLWVELLASHRKGAAVGAAVATATVKLRRGLNPLLQRALAAGTQDWRVFAWAAGEFGTAAVKAAARLQTFEPDHMAWVLAHAVRSGAGRDVEKARSSGTPGVAEAATRAVGRVDDARAYDAALRHSAATGEYEALASRMLNLLAKANGAETSKEA